MAEDGAKPATYTTSTSLRGQTSTAAQAAAATSTALETTNRTCQQQTPNPGGATLASSPCKLPTPPPIQTGCCAVWLAFCNHPCIQRKSTPSPETLGSVLIGSNGPVHPKQTRSVDVDLCMVGVTLWRAAIPPAKPEAPPPTFSSTSGSRLPMNRLAPTS